MYPLKWFSVLAHFWMPATLPIELISLKTHSLHSKQPSRSFTHTVKSSVHLVFDLLASTLPDNTHSFISSIKSRSLVLLVGYVHQSLNPATLQLSNGLGVVQTAMKLWGRCCLPISGLTSSFELVQISSSMGCSPPPICHLRNLSYPLATMMGHWHH